MATNLIDVLQAQGFTVGKAPESVAIDCTIVEFSEPFYFTRNRNLALKHLDDLESIEHLNNIVRKTHECHLLFPQIKDTEQTIPFTIITQKEYDQLCNVFQNIERINKQMQFLQDEIKSQLGRMNTLTTTKNGSSVYQLTID